MFARTVYGARAPLAVGVLMTLFVIASTALGNSRLRNLRKHVLPNAIAPIIVTATVSLGIYIVAEATLSFLGLGLPPTVMSWGADISTAQGSIRQQPMVLFYPAAALALTVLSSLLEIQDLDVPFTTQNRLVPAVRGANLTIYPGQTVAIVGESGSGKSTTAHAIIDLLPGTGKVNGGKILFEGTEISGISRKEIVALRRYASTCIDCHRAGSQAQIADCR